MRGSKLTVGIEQGTRFGMLEVVREGERAAPNSNGQRHRRFVCKCDCGAESLTVMGNLKGGRTKSCGCNQSSHNMRKGESSSFYKHGQSRSPLYAEWTELRGHLKRNGVKLCAHLSTFEGFIEAFSETYKEGFRLHLMEATPVAMKHHFEWGLGRRSRYLYIVYGKEYSSLQAVAKELNCSKQCVHQDFARGKDGYARIDKRISS